jgi:hypothetical protein
VLPRDPLALNMNNLVHSGYKYLKKIFEKPKKVLGKFEPVQEYLYFKWILEEIIYTQNSMID